PPRADMAANPPHSAQRFWKFSGQLFPTPAAEQVQLTDPPVPAHSGAPRMEIPKESRLLARQASVQDRTFRDRRDMRRSLLIGLLLLASVASAQTKKNPREADLGKKSATTIDKSLAGDISRKKEKEQDAPALQYD